MSEQEKDAVQETEQEESSTSTEEESQDSTQESTDKESKSVPYDRFKEVNEELKRLKQEKLDALEKKGEQKESPKPQESNLSEDDLFAIKQLDTKEELDYARKVAKLEDISLSDAIANPIFTTWQKQRAEEQKQEQVAMQASKGSGSRGKKKDLSTPGLSPEDHKSLWKKKAGIE